MMDREDDETDQSGHCTDKAQTPNSSGDSESWLINTVRRKVKQREPK